MYTAKYCAYTAAYDVLLIAAQSGDVEPLKGDQPIPLFCIATNHTLQTDYQWYEGDSAIGVSGPVLYTNRNGVYKCKVSFLCPYAEG